MTNSLIPLGQNARAAADPMAQISTAQKNAALEALAKNLEKASPTILAANAQDITEAQKNGMEPAQLDRLKLDPSRIQAMIQSLNIIQSLPDPVDRLMETVTRPNGLRIEKRSVPLGVIGLIFESRPNVAIDAAALCLKSGNASILRGGSESWHSVQALVSVIRDTLEETGLPRNAVQTLPSPDRALVSDLLTLDPYVDVIIPRGGKSLIARVRDESRIPVLSHLDGICHTYIDAKADPVKAVALTLNAKMRRTSICGATECLILHAEIAPSLGKEIIKALLKSGCEVRVPEELILTAKSPDTYVPQERWCSLPLEGRVGEGGVKLGKQGSDSESLHQADLPPPCPSPQGGGNASGKYRSELSAVGIKHLDPALKPVSPADYGFEFLAPIIAVAIVPDLQEAVNFINHYGSHHTDAIITEDPNAAAFFLHHVNSAITLHNASTQFADGGEFGKGAEIGIATGKLHARGPVGLEELTTYQYRVYGAGQVRA